jgi:hypothetical protein
MKPMTLSCCRIAARLTILAALALAVSQLGGCALWRRPAPLTLPQGFMTNPQAAALANPATRAATYKKLFPELSSIQASGGLVASKRWRPGKEVADFNYYSISEKPDSAEHMMRLRGSRGPVSVFDVIVRGRYATVINYLAKVYFQGTIPAEGSPFGERFGVEPWDLAAIFTIGQKVAAGEFEAERGERTTTLRPKGGAAGAGAAGGLKRVEIENRSGLPTMAEWEMSGRTYEIEYLGWEFFRDSRFGEESEIRPTRLMPTELKIKIKRGGLRLALEVRAYQYDKAPSEKMFMPIIDQNFRELPLEQLRSLLQRDARTQGTSGLRLRGRNEARRAERGTRKKIRTA